MEVSAAGGLWDRDRGPSVSFEIPQNKTGRQPKSHQTIAAAWVKPAAAQFKEVSAAGRDLGIGTGGHPSLFEIS